MKIGEELQLTKKIRQYDGYQNDPIWEPESEGENTYDGAFEDGQCTVPCKVISTRIVAVPVVKRGVAYAFADSIPNGKEKILNGNASEIRWDMMEFDSTRENEMAMCEYKEENAMKKVCVSLKSLYDEYIDELSCGEKIEFSSDGESDYYDIRNDSGEYLFSDGEEAYILSENEKEVLLQNCETGFCLTLTPVEYKIAVFL